MVRHSLSSCWTSLATNWQLPVDLGKYLANETTLDTIFDANQCLIDWIDYMYNFAGARNFLFMNVCVVHPDLFLSAQGARITDDPAAP